MLIPFKLQCNMPQNMLPADIVAALIHVHSSTLRHKMNRKHIEIVITFKVSKGFVRTLPWHRRLLAKRTPHQQRRLNRIACQMQRHFRHLFFHFLSSSLYLFFTCLNVVSTSLLQLHCDFVSFYRTSLSLM